MNASKLRHVENLALLLGAFACAFSTAWPFRWGFEPGQALWALQIVGLSALCWVLNRCVSLRAAAQAGLLFALVWLSATFWWLHVAMHVYAGLHSLLAACAVVVLAAALGSYYAAASALYWRLKTAGGAGAACGLFAAFWTLAELARGTWFTGFGWGAAGYAHVDGPLAWYAPWVGSYGVGALAAWLAMCVAQLPRKVWSSLAAGLALVLLPGLMPAGVNQWSSAAGGISIALLQGNVPQSEKFEPARGVALALAWYREQLRSSATDVVVTPETAIPLLPQQLPEAYLADLAKHFSSISRATLIGVPLGNFEQGYTNSALGFGGAQSAAQVSQQGPWRYDKQHLVPFGEFIPPWFKWFTAMMRIPLGDFNRGAQNQASFPVAGQRLAVNICYEDLFGEELAVRFLNPQQAPTIFVNMSNIAWFGDTVAIPQHLHISRMRALEFQTPFVRATNTGATVIMDHHANIRAALPSFTRGVLVEQVQGRHALTPYAWWVARAGLWPLWMLALAAFVWAWWRQKKIKAVSNTSTPPK